jgi:hypothetical protein
MVGDDQSGGGAAGRNDVQLIEQRSFRTKILDTLCRHHDLVETSEEIRSGRERKGPTVVEVSKDLRHQGT